MLNRLLPGHVWYIWCLLQFDLNNPLQTGPGPIAVSQIKVSCLMFIPYFLWFSNINITVSLQPYASHHKACPSIAIPCVQINTKFFGRLHHNNVWQCLSDLHKACLSFVISCIDVNTKWFGWIKQEVYNLCLAFQASLHEACFSIVISCIKVNTECFWRVHPSSSTVPQFLDGHLNKPT